MSTKVIYCQEVNFRIIHVILIFSQAGLAEIHRNAVLTQPEVELVTASKLDYANRGSLESQWMESRVLLK